MRHSLGLDSSSYSYRNYFQSAPQHRDQPTIDQLVAKGLMALVPDAPYWYYVTDEGKKAF
jgi:hypothetical protein